MMMTTSAICSTAIAGSIGYQGLAIGAVAAGLGRRGLRRGHRRLGSGGARSVRLLLAEREARPRCRKAPGACLCVDIDELLLQYSGRRARAEETLVSCRTLETGSTERA